MAKYDITYACGHSGVTQIYGPHKSREYILRRRASGDCPECDEIKMRERHARQNATAMQKAAEQELPKLLGTEKQIPYAETCRQRYISQMETFIEESQRFPDWMDELSLRFGYPVAESVDVLDFAIRTKNTARWWIDFFRNREIGEGMRLLYYELQAERKLATSGKPAAAAPPVEEVPPVRPEKPVSEMVIDISVSGDTVCVFYPKRHETLYTLLREKLRLRWADAQWRRKITSINGTVEDRAAEIGHRLLAKGFIVRIADETIRDKAIRGDYEPEITRWILKMTAGNYVGWFAVSWDRITEDFYDAARRITGSQWAKPYVAVPTRYYQEVLDFAARYNFKVSAAALQLVAEAEQRRAEEMVAVVPPPAEETPVNVSLKPTKMDVPKEVEADAEFRDDD